MNKARVLNLRGTNGTGKSTVAYGLLGGAEMIDMYGVPGYLTSEGVYVLGKYKTACGGCDTIKTQDWTISAILDAIGLGPIFFEGLLISGIFSTWLNVSKKLKVLQGRMGAPEEGMVWAFLDTPLDVCLERVYKRNGGKVIKEKLVEDKFRAVHRVAEKAADAGEIVFWIDHTKALSQVHTLLMEESLL